jgi:hypothetical protein
MKQVGGSQLEKSNTEPYTPTLELATLAHQSAKKEVSGRQRDGESLTRVGGAESENEGVPKPHRRAIGVTTPMNFTN